MDCIHGILQARILECVAVLMDVKAAWGEEGRFGRLGLMYIHYDTMNKAYLMKHTVSLRELNALW